MYCFLRWLFGLINAPITLQRALDLLLSVFKLKSYRVYLDNVIIFSKSIEEHFNHVEEILLCLHSSGITLKLKKCDFFTDTVHYLSHKTRPGHLETDEVVTVDLLSVRQSKDQTGFKSFFGLYNLYRRFVPRYSHVSAPLNKLLRNEHPFELSPLNEEEDSAFKSLIKEGTEPPFF